MALVSHSYCNFKQYNIFKIARLFLEFNSSLFCFIFIAWRTINTEFVGSSWADTIKNWKIIGVSTSPSSLCSLGGSTQKLYGGVGKFGTGVILIKTYKSLPPHKQLRITFNGYFIAKQSVTSNHAITVCGDYNSATYTCNDANSIKSYTYTSSGVNLYQCQVAALFEKKFAFSHTFSHSKLDVDIEIENNFVLQSSDLSLAISDFKLEVDSCHSSCATCNGDMFDNCLTCVSYATISSNSCICNPGYYPQYQQAPCLISPCFSCKQCDSTCATCYGPSATQCLTCNPLNSPKRYLQNFQCVLDSECADGTYPNVLSLKCDSCHQSCSTCTGSVDQQCKSCPALRYLNPVNDVDIIGKCVSVCPDGKVLIVKKCITCKDTDCMECENDQPNTCKRCTTNTSKNFLLLNKVCLNVRPDNTFYQDNTQGKIFSCISPCKTCSQYQGTVCQSCVPGYSLSANTCVVNCPSGQYSLSQVCQPCDANCKTCSGSATYCLSCNLNQFVDPADSNKCKSCTGSTYGDVISGTCKPCDSTCQTCDGGTDKDCLSCYQTGTTKLYYIVSTKQCVDNCPAFPSDLYGDDVSVPKLCVQGQDCPAKYFPDANSTPRKCNSCDPLCSQCFGPSNVECSACEGVKFLQGTQCIDSCLPGYYPDVSRKCQLCDKSCKECSGGGPNNCINCNPPLYLYENGTDKFCKVKCDIPTYGDNAILKCVLSCDPNFYPNNATRICTPCDSSCNGCTGGQKKDCVNCASPYFKYQGLCDYCPDSYYGNNVTQQCDQCPSQCAICTGSSTCQKCNVNYFLEGSTCLLQCPSPRWGSYLTQTCESSCPVGTYGAIVNTFERVCYLCTDKCANCSNSSTCIDCFYPYFLNDSNQCIEECPSNQFPNRQLRICQNCDSSCKTCTGGLSSNCKSCSSGLLYDGTCYAICPDGTYANGDYCSEKCEKGYYPDIGTKKCEKCNVNCQECDGKLFNNCITCPVGKILINKYCVTQCIDGYYEKLIPISEIDITRTNENTTVRICQKCSSECQKCVNTKASTVSEVNITCQQCSAEYYLNDQTCIKECPTEKIMNIPNRTCDNCPLGYYKYDNQTCKECHFSCKKCNGNRYNDCTECWETRGREQIQSDKTVLRLPYRSVCECEEGMQDLMENECTSSKGSEYHTIKAAQSFSIIFSSLMFFDLYFFGNPVNLLFSFELVQQISLLQYTNVPLSLNIQQLLQFIQGFHLTDLPPKPMGLDVNSPTSSIDSQTSTASRMLSAISSQNSSYKFSSNDKSNNFLNNSIYLIGVHLFLWGFIFFCKLSMKNFKLKRLGFLNKVYFYLDLTVMLVVYFITNYEMFLNIVLQLNDVDTSTPFNSFSVALCIIFLVYYGFFFIKIIFKINVDSIFFKSKPPRKPYLINQFTRWCLLFFTVRQRKPLQRNFYVILQLKKMLICILLVTLYNFPEVQILSTLFVYLVFFVYLAIYKPIVNPYILGLLLVNEAFMIVFFILTFVIQQFQYTIDISIHLNRTLLALMFLVFFANVVISFIILFKKRNQIKQQLIGVYNIISNFIVRRNRVKDYQQDQKEKKRRNKKPRIDKMGDIIEEDEDDDEQEDDEEEQDGDEDDYSEDLYVQDAEGEGVSISPNEKRFRRVKKKKLNDLNKQNQKSSSQKQLTTQYYNIQEKDSKHGVIYLKEDLNYQQRIQFRNHLRRDQRLPKISQNKGKIPQAGIAQIQINQIGNKSQQQINQSLHNLNSSQLDNSIVQHLDNSMDQSFQQILGDRSVIANNESSEYSIINLDQQDWNGNQINKEKLDQVDEMDEIIDEALDQEGEINMERIRQLQLKRSDQSYSPMLRYTQNSQPQDMRGSYLNQQQQYGNLEEYIGTHEDFNNRPSSRLEENYYNNQLTNQMNQNYQYGQDYEGDQNQEGESQQGDDFNIQQYQNMDVQFQELFGFNRIEYYDHTYEEEQRRQREIQEQNYREYMRQSQQSALQNMNIYQNNLKQSSSGLRTNQSRNVIGARDYTSPNLIERYNEVDPEQLQKYMEYKKKYKLTQKFGFLSKPSLTSSPQKRLNSSQNRGEDPQRIASQLDQFYQQQGIIQNKFEDNE